MIINKIVFYVTNIKAGKSIALETLNKICIMCKLQPGDILEVIPTDEEKIKYYSNSTFIQNLLLFYEKTALKLHPCDL